MKKLLALFSTVAIITPSLAFAAFNDVNLTSDTTLSVGGVSVTVDASGATLESIVVSADSFVATLVPGSSMTVRSTALRPLNLTTSNLNGSYSSECTDTYSSVTATFPAGFSGTVDVTITPDSSTTCTAASTATASTGSNGPVASSGGGGGGYTPTPPPTPTPVPGDTNALIATLQAQIQVLLAQLAALGGSPSVSFSRDLEIGSTGSDVKALQVWLNTHGYVIASSGPGSSGNETTKFGGLTRAALAKFQKAVGISPAVGYFGPKTRADIAAHP